MSQTHNSQLSRIYSQSLNFNDELFFLFFFFYILHRFRSTHIVWHNALQWNFRFCCTKNVRFPLNIWPLLNKHVSNLGLHWITEEEKQNSANIGREGKNDKKSFPNVNKVSTTLFLFSLVTLLAFTIPLNWMPLGGH